MEKKAEKVDVGEKGGEAGECAQKVTVTVKVDLILGAAGASPLPQEEAAKALPWLRPSSSRKILTN